MRIRIIVFTLVCAVLAACGPLAVATAPAKKASPERSPLALSADEAFWTVFHAGDAARGGEVLKRVTAAYLADPNDAVTAAHVGFLHAWRLAERSRQARPDATVTDGAILARRYFEEAVRLDPADARYKGFLGAMQLAEGAIHHDETLTRRGYSTLREAIEAWPEFNLFTAGYVMSDQPAGSEHFREALDWQWRTLDLCAGQPIDRARPDCRAILPAETREGPKRACWNSWIAPHNVEGFFLNMGDMVVKSGDWRTAQVVYANARLSPDYRSWRFAPVLERRFRDAEANVVAFAEPGQPGRAPEERMMFNAPFACMACHQR